MLLKSLPLKQFVKNIRSRMLLKKYLESVATNNRTQSSAQITAAQKNSR